MRAYFTHTLSCSKSLVGRFWRWQINFCPSWRGYFKSLPPELQEELRKKYNFNPKYVISMTPLVGRQDSDGITHLHLRRFLTKGLE